MRLSERVHESGSIPPDAKFQYVHRVELRTANVLLRRFRESDVEDALGYRDDPEFARFLPHVPQPFTRADAERFVATNMTEPWDTLPTFAVVLERHVIGTVNLEIDPVTRVAMIGYAIARAHWGRGLATEAARAVLEWGFAEHDLVEMWASTDVANVRSRRVLEKLGMTLQPGDTREVRYAIRR
jgi:[ribosomal protein S5]-alanine N-acetyltransferase